MGTVLVADDSGDIRRVVREILEDEGHAVIDAADGRTALALLSASAVSLLVLLDERMPGMGGTQVLGAVAADPALRRHAYTLATAVPGLAIDFPFAVGLLAKPFDLDALIDAVRAMEASLPAGS